MYLTEMFKNYKTKRKLREENIRLSEKNKNLEEELNRVFTMQYKHSTNIIREERNIHKLVSNYLIKRDDYFETEYIKRKIADNMLNELEHVIQYDFYDTDMGRVYVGMLWAVTGDKKNE